MSASLMNPARLTRARTMMATMVRAAVTLSPERRRMATKTAASETASEESAKGTMSRY